MKYARVAAATLGVALHAAVPVAQQYRARVDATAQAITFRGLRADSIAIGDTVAGGLGPMTSDGHAVRCGVGPHCFFFRTGPTLRAVPVAATGHVTVWGLGVDGLSVRATARLVGDLGRDDVWPGSDDRVQLLEGYVEYQHGVLATRGGRQLVMSRLEPIGFDGAWARARLEQFAIDLTGYAGWGLGRASAMTASSPALNPLDEWRPRDRQYVAGVETAWMSGDSDVRAEYRREVDPRDGNFVSERAAMSFGVGAGSWRAAGGLDYNLAEGRTGSADVAVTLLQPRYSATMGARRYRPYFSLWTLWGAFSPVPYHAAFASARVQATDRVTLVARAERYGYAPADVSTALVTNLESRGWRTSAGVAAVVRDRWRLDANYALEFGPGAAGRFVDASVEYTLARYAVSGYGGILQRPLEFRYYDARSGWLGAHVDARLLGHRRVWVDATVIFDDRQRPDAAASSMGQLRLRTGLTLSFGSGTDQSALPPARPLR